MNIEEVIKSLEKYVKNQNFSGFDPYDALNSKMLNNINSKFLRVLITQLFVYSPINFRKFFNIKKGFNPKALGLFLSSYCNLYKTALINNNLFKEVTENLVKLLLDTNSNGYSGYCWGFNFNWQDSKRNANKFTPTIVVTSFVGNSFLDLYEITHKQKYFDIAENITKFIINDLNIRKFKNGICFSYSPIDNHVIHNANFLGAAFLSRVYNTNKDKELLDYSKKAIDYSMSRQNKNGSWEYLLDPDSGKVRNQFDFHQGFIIDALFSFIKYSDSDDNKYLNSIEKAVSFYKQNQFYTDGRAKWRLPYSYPIDIHQQAQGIITFCKIYSLFADESYLDFSKIIAKWTIKNMYDPKGFFYYQKWPIFTNKNSYMRWNQAWIMLALSCLLNEIKYKKG